MTTDATQVTGGPAGTAGLQPGAVLAERYELLEVLDREGPSIGFRALDQETERPVLLRVLSGNVRSKVRDQMVERLRGLVGVGGRFLSSLLDADHEGAAPFTVEAWPTGTQLTSILDSRRAREEPLGPRELLPVVARLAAALDAIPRHWVHGDVRPERVWLDTDGLRLTGPFLLVALPKGVLTDHMGQLGPGEVAYPPDLRAGTPSGSADRWGVAAIAWEALTGRSADEAGVAAGRDEVPEGLRGPLVSLLSADPLKRPRDLTALIAALAGEAKLPVPQLDPEPHAPPTAEVGRPPARPALRIPKAPRQKLSKDATVRVASEAVGIAGAAPDGTQEIAFDQIIEDRPADSLDPHLVRMALAEKQAREEDDDESADETAKHRSVSVSDADAVLDSSSLDPRLLRAAMTDQASREIPDSGESIDPSLVRAAMAADDADQTMPGGGSSPTPATRTHNDSLDPRLVRAALGVDLESESAELLASQELDIESEDLELLDPPTQRARADAPNEAPKKPFPGAKPVASRPPGAKSVASRPPGAGPAPRAASPVPKPRPAAAAKSAPSAPPQRSLPAKPKPQSKPQSKPQPSAKRSAPNPPQPKPAAPAASADKPKAPPSARPAPQARPNAQTKPSHPLPEARAVTAVVPNPAKRSRNDDTPAAVRRTRGEPPPKSNAGVMIVAGALLLALVIVAVGFLIASQRRSEAARTREIQERLQQIRSEETPPDPG